jgi:hypothetical protein
MGDDWSEKGPAIGPNMVPTSGMSIVRLVEVYDRGDFNKAKLVMFRSASLTSPAQRETIK